MADSGVDRLLASLDAMFDAAIAREEEEAASDLAHGLLQDLSLAETLPRMGSLTALLPGGESLPISVVGRDYVAGGSPPTIVPVTRAMLLSADGSAPEIRAEDLVATLRRVARTGQMVRVKSEGVNAVGRLRRAGVDHLLLETATGRHIAVGMGAVGAVTLGLEGSVDVRY